MPKMPAAMDADDDLLAGLKTELSRRFWWHILQRPEPGGELPKRPYHAESAFPILGCEEKSPPLLAQ
ncbi:hypothetical protein ACPYPF_09840 [Streptomyces albidoflavus]|uniref:hypothetical protein n=1 Tax=Streptomyces albidoflavus TaxID=1886 RepID=UPI0032466E2A